MNSLKLELLKANLVSSVRKNTKSARNTLENIVIAYYDLKHDLLSSKYKDVSKDIIIKKYLKQNLDTWIRSNGHASILIGNKEGMFFQTNDPDDNMQYTILGDLINLGYYNRAGKMISYFTRNNPDFIMASTRGNLEFTLDYEASLRKILIEQLESMGATITFERDCYGSSFEYKTGYVETMAIDLNIK